MEKKERSSNLELLRIILMFVIIAHHYVVNSGITECYDFNNITPNMIFLQFFGFGGKMAINVFILISGYFMCKSKLTVQKVLKLILQVYFYNVIFFVILTFLGFQKVSFLEVFKKVFWFRNINGGFTASFIIFYVFVPFYNKLLSILSQKEHKILCLSTIGISTILSTFLFSQRAFTEVGWYISLYFLASYIRFYPNKYTEQKYYSIVWGGAALLLTFVSILVVDFIGVKFGFESYYHMYSDSDKLFALILSVSLFVLFKNLRIPQSRFVNKVASTVFGVLLIHANSDAMRTFLWKNVCKVPEMYTVNLGTLVLHAVCCVTVIFVVCSVIDYLRIITVEKWVMRSFEK